MKLICSTLFVIVLSLMIPSTSFAFSQTVTNGDSATVTIPAGVTTVRFYARGGNGGGVGSCGRNNCAGGGGGGAFAYSSSVGYIVYVGGGGGAGSNSVSVGGAGGSTAGNGVGIGGTISGIYIGGENGIKNGSGGAGGYVRLSSNNSFYSYRALGGTPGYGGASQASLGAGGGAGGFLAGLASPNFSPSNGGSLYAGGGGTSISCGGGGGGYGGGGGGYCTGAYGYNYANMAPGGGGSSFFHPSLSAPDASGYVSIPVSVIGTSISLYSGAGGRTAGYAQNATGNPGTITIAWDVPTPVNCAGSWSDTNTCSVTGACGQTGVKQQTYTITTAAANEGVACSYVNGATQWGSTSCSTVVCPASCSLWGSTIASGNSVTAYQSSSVVSPAICTSETRTCANSVLSGTYTNQSCTVTAPVIWTNYCTGGSDVNGNYWQIWAYSNETPTGWKYVEPGTVANGCAAPPPVVTLNGRGCVLPATGTCDITSWWTVTGLPSSETVDMDVTGPGIAVNIKNLPADSKNLSAAATAKLAAVFAGLPTTKSASTPFSKAVGLPGTFTMKLLKHSDSSLLGTALTLSACSPGYTLSATGVCVAPLTCNALRSGEVSWNTTAPSSSAWVSRVWKESNDPSLACTYHCDSTHTWDGGKCAADCTLDGTPIKSGYQTTASTARTATSPITCASISEIRSCTDSSLSGTYPYVGCTQLTPTIDTFTATPSRVQSGSTTTLNWTTTDATSCSISGTNGFTYSIPSASLASGSHASDPVTTQTTYTLTCSGASSSKSVMVNVVLWYSEF